MGRWKRFREFIAEVWSELTKTTWPSKKEVTGTTLVVIVTVIVCAAYLGVVDIILSRAMNYVLKVFAQ